MIKNQSINNKTSNKNKINNQLLIFDIKNLYKRDKMVYRHILYIILVINILLLSWCLISYNTFKWLLKSFYFTP